MSLLSESATGSLKEYGRGMAGGLIFSLPLLYTMEIWWTGFVADPAHLILYVLITFLLLLAYNYYVGVRRDTSWREEIMDAVEEMGLGILVSMLVLYLIGRITADMPWQEVAGKIIVEAMPVAIGVSVGKVQLGGNGNDTDKGHSACGKGQDVSLQGHESEQGSDEGQHHGTTFLGQLILGICGAVLVASNVAPTEEIVLIGIETHPWKLLGLALLSVAIGGAILYYSDFHGADRIRRPESVFDVFAGIIVMYSVALITSAFMLWFFGRFEGMPVYVMAAQTVVLGFPATLGASAGRLLLQV